MRSHWAVVCSRRESQLFLGAVQRIKEMHHRQHEKKGKKVILQNITIVRQEYIMNMVETYLTPKTPTNGSRISSPTSLSSFDDDANTPSGLISVDSKCFNHEEEDRTSSSSPPSLKFKFDYFDTTSLIATTATSRCGSGNSLSRSSDFDDDTAPSSSGGGLSSEDCGRYQHHSAEKVVGENSNTHLTTTAATLVYQHDDQVVIRKCSEVRLKPRPSADSSSLLSSSLSSFEEGSNNTTTSSFSRLQSRRSSSSSIMMDDYITSKKMKIQVL